MTPSSAHDKNISARRRVRPLGWRKQSSGAATSGAPAITPGAEPLPGGLVEAADTPSNGTAPPPDGAIADSLPGLPDAPAEAPAAPSQPTEQTALAVDAAPRRAVPLAPPTAKELAAAREIAQAAARPRLAARAAAAKARRPALEKKLAGATDSEQMLQVLDVELALQRARRLSGSADKQREALRVLSILMLFGLVIVVVGTMWYLQTLQQGRANFSRQRPAAPAAAAPQ